MHRPAGRSGARLRRPPARLPRRARGHHHLLAVGERGSQVHLREIGFPGGPARAGDGVRDPRALLQPVQARPAHGADDVHHHPRGRQPGHARGLGRRRGERRHRGRACAQDEASREQDQRERARGGQEQPPPLEEELRHAADRAGESVTRG